MTDAYDFADIAVLADIGGRQRQSADDGIEEVSCDAGHSL